MSPEMKQIIVSIIFKKRQICSEIVFCAYCDRRLIIDNVAGKIN
jgi:hypothetical protein